MCDGHPCDCLNEARIIQEATPEDATISIWGPVSVEMPSADQPIPKLIRLEAVRQALPQILKRERFSVKHHDQLVGQIQSSMTPDPARVPAHHSEVRAMVESVVKDHGGLPTGIIPVTEAIAAVFPRLKPFVGQEAAFAGGIIYGDNDTARVVQRDIRQGKLDSFSISGTTFETNLVEWCDAARGCYQVEEVKDMDGSAITIGSSRGGTGSAFDAKTMNHGAAFVVVQQAEARLGDSKTGGGNGQALKQATRVAGSGTHMPDEPAKNTEPPKPVAQTAPASTPAAPKTESPKDVKQQEPGAGTPPAPNGNGEALLGEIMRRLENCEKAIAAMRSGSAEQEAPAPAAQAAPKAPKVDQVTMEKVHQAIQEALKAQAPAAPKPVVQAKPARTVQTPEPATPGATGNSREELKEIMQAVDSGDPVAVKKFIHAIQRRA